MVYQKRSVASRWWPLQLPDRRSPLVGDGWQEKAKIEFPPPGASPHALEATRGEHDALAHADRMEKGLAKEFAEDFLRPLPEQSQLHRFHVLRSADRLSYRLFREDDGEFQMYAEVRKHSREIRFFLYDPEDKENSLFDAERPAFSMTFDRRQKEWLMSHYSKDWYSSRQDSDGHRDKQDVAVVFHSRLEVGDGLNHCIDADVLLAAPVVVVDETCAEDTATTVVKRLLTKQAVWNEELKTLVLDFKGRKVIPSAKNFQLTEEGASRVVLQHGKIENNKFSLDFRCPLSISQAFALVLTTIFWE